MISDLSRDHRVRGDADVSATIPGWMSERRPATAGLVDFYPSSLRDARLHVLFVTNMWPDSETSHYGIFVQSQARSLEAEGIAVDVLAIRGNISGRAYALAPREVRRQSRVGRYDVTHVHTGHALAASLGATIGPVVVSFVGGDILGHPHKGGVTPKSRVEAALFRQLSRIPTLTITKSQEMERVLPTAVRARNTVIPNGVDLSALAPIGKKDARRLVGWSLDEKVALFLGNPADPRKNIELARAAVGEAQRVLPELRFHSDFHLLHDEVPPLLWAADCLVFSSRGEGSPNLVKEAMAAGLPIVATPVGDVRERLEGVEGCFVVEPQVSAFAKAIVQAVRFDRAPAAQEAVQSLSLTAVANRVIEVYDKAIRRYRRHGRS